MERPVDPRLLQAFVTVAREGNVSRAAERLHLTQPAISQKIKELSELVQLELFHRGPKGVVLTADGSALLESAEKALNGLLDFTYTAARLKGGIHGQLRVGTILDPEFTRLGAFLNELVKVAPNLEPTLEHGMSGEVLTKLVEDKLDVGFYVGAVQENWSVMGIDPAHMARFEMRTLTRFSYKVIAPPGWSNRVNGKNWVDLMKLPWVVTPPVSVHHRLIQGALGNNAMAQNTVAMVDQESSMLALVRSGVGLSLARDSIAIHESQTNGVAIANSVSINANLYFVYKKAMMNNPVLEAALLALDRVWSKTDNA